MTDGSLGHRWNDAVEVDLRKLQANDLRKTVHNRRKWRNLVSEVKTHID